MEAISEQFGHLLKIDDHTSNLIRSKFARIWMEMDLSEQLMLGIWVSNEDERVMVGIFYERLPAFCFHCGCISHFLSN